MEISSKSVSNDNSLFASAIGGPNEAERLQGEGSIKNSIKHYYYLKRQFKMIGRPELTERMLRHIIKFDHIPKDFQTRPLYINLSGIIDELMLNELEIALWAIYLENLVWKNFDTYTERVLLFSAYKAKQYFNGNNIEIYRKYLIAKINDFEVIFQSWVKKYEGEFEVDLKMINQKLNLLKVIKDNESDYSFLNYNYYVDMILLTAIPYAKTDDQIAKLKFMQKNKIEKLEDENTKTTKNNKPMKRVQKICKKKMKIEKDDDLINNIDLEDKDPNIAKIEEFCDGLIDCNDLNPEEFF